MNDGIAARYIDQRLLNGIIGLELVGRERVLQTIERIIVEPIIFDIVASANTLRAEQIDIIDDSIDFEHFENLPT